jgi:hypothetical protein
VCSFKNRFLLLESSQNRCEWVNEVLLITVKIRMVKRLWYFHRELVEGCPEDLDHGLMSDGNPAVTRVDDSPEVATAPSKAVEIVCET